MIALKIVAAAAAALASATAGAQVAPPPLPPGMIPPDPVKTDFIAKSGSDTVYFAGSGHRLDAQARATLTAQAMWLIANPAILVRIEGHAGLTDTRDHAIGVGARRAAAVRDYLLLNGVPAAQVSAVTFGKERPATTGLGEALNALNRRAVTVLVR